MKTFAQGEITIIKIGAKPAGFDGGTPLAADGAHYVVGHSETGHHHVIERDAGTVVVAKDAPAGMRVLYALFEKATTLEHLRSHDTHAPIALEPGYYEFRIGREYDPYEKLARQQAD